MNYPSYLIHYGVKCQHWGERQYQYMDGTYTPLGKERRRIGSHDDNSESSVKTNKSIRKESSEQKAKRIMNMDLITEKNYKKYLSYNKNNGSSKLDYGDLDDKNKKKITRCC